MTAHQEQDDFKLFLFGTPVLTRNGKTLPIKRNRCKALLAYIAMQRLPQSREGLATLFWPENDQSTALTNLRRELARLNKYTGKNLIVSDRSTIGINPRSNLWIDAIAFIESTERGQKTKSELLDLYTDDFLSGFTLPNCPEFDEWQFFQAETLRVIFASTLQLHITKQEKAQNYSEAITAARRLLSLDSLNEPIHRVLMRLYALYGQYAAAIRQYHICAQTLETELGIEAEDETKALLKAIQAKEIGPSASSKPATDMEEVASDPVESTPIIRHNIPTIPASFVGRKQEIKQIQHYLIQTDTRLLTLRGIGGIGKTRLAIQALSELVETDTFPDGLFVVNLVGIDDPSYLVPTIAETLRFNLSDANDPLEQLIKYIGSKEILLLLDNFEHLQSGASQLTFLLQHCPQLKLLVTSRHQLKLTGEFVVVVEGLPLPDQSDSSSSAVRLFEDRASQLAPSLDLKAERPFIQAICRLVEGMPLAIEMCAAWIQIINCQEILGEIQQGLDLLEIQKADLPTRHFSVRAVFQSSYNLLTDAEQEVLLNLAVFRGDFSHFAAREVAKATLIRLRSLVEKSLLSNLGDSAETRYLMHSLLRQFALEKISTEQMEKIEKAHAEFFVNLLAGLGDKLCTAEHPSIVPVVLTETDNLRGMWHWLGRQVASQKQTEIVCKSIRRLLPSWRYTYFQQTKYLEGRQLINTVWQPMERLGWETAEFPDQQWIYAILATTQARFLMELGQLDEAIQLSKKALATFHRHPDLYPQVSKQYISAALHIWGRTDLRLGDADAAIERLQESIDTAPDGLTKAEPIYTFGILYTSKGKYEKAIQKIEESLALYKACHDHSRELRVTNGIGSVLIRQQKFEEAVFYFKRVEKAARKIDRKMTLMVSLTNLAFCMKNIGRFGRVTPYYEEAEALAREMGKERWLAVISQELGQFLLEQGEMSLAENRIQQGLQLALSLNTKPDIMSSLFTTAQLQAQKGSFVEAMVAAKFVMNHDSATAEVKRFAAEFWDELSSELPPIFTQRAQAKLENATLDDILAMLSH